MVRGLARHSCSHLPLNLTALVRAFSTTQERRHQSSALLKVFREKLSWLLLLAIPFYALQGTFP